MQETLKVIKRNKVNLEDYDFQSDVDNRILLSSFQQRDRAILEEILYSPLQFSLQKLADNLELPLSEVLPTIKLLERTKLFKFDSSVLTVNKEKRKYFEARIELFEEDFAPGMEFLQNVLKTVPIDVLPIWYHIPRTSNNIFESLVEKYLQTPQIFHRYLLEFTGGDDLVAQVATRIYGSPNFSVDFSDLMKEFSLSHEELTKIAIYLEFSLIAVTKLIPVGDGWVESLSAFSEWASYQSFLSSSLPQPIKPKETVEWFRKAEYAFVEDMKMTLLYSQNQDIAVTYDKEGDHYTLCDSGPLQTHLNIETNDLYYLNRIINKLLILGLAVLQDDRLKPSLPSTDWMETPVAQRAHITFKHPHNFVAMQKVSPLTTQRAILEIEKSIATISQLGWVYFDEFMKGSQIVLHEEQKIILKSTGKGWAYAIPNYTKEEALFIKTIVLEWLFEGGIVQVGTHNDRACFALTNLGESLFKN